ncbi:unnamed protein product [Gongylonema pulchrum]|uniref:Ferredoxin n=1 Tax=Gongylonema pulchrum TaxID=637853 RepID=A0A183D247_9BILA|nr:unnamed protein product [Gongylonema pulchrum]
MRFSRACVDARKRIICTGVYMHVICCQHDCMDCAVFNDEFTAFRNFLKGVQAGMRNVKVVAGGGGASGADGAIADC